MALRIQHGYEARQPWVAPCPSCGCLLRGVYARERGLESDDVTENGKSWKDQDPLATPTLNICTDFPLPRAYITEASLFTPVMEMQLHVKLGDLLQRDTPLLHPEWENLERRLEQLVESHLNKNGKQFRLVRDKLLGETSIPGLRNLNHSTLLRLLFRAISAPTQDDLHEKALQELRRDLDVVSKSWKTLGLEAKAALQDSGVLDAIRQPAWLSAKVLARQAGAMLSAHVAQHIRDHGLDLSNFRSVRGDYEELASAYARCFEAVSKGIALAAFTRSLPVSGNRIDWKDSKGRIHQLTAAEALEKLSAFQREPLSSPTFSMLYATIDRQRRNGIGHHADRYDFASGDLHFTDGSKEGFLVFLIELQAFFRLVDWLVELVASWEELLRTGELDLALRNEPINPWPEVTPSFGGRVFVDPVRGPASGDIMQRVQARLDYLQDKRGADEDGETE